MNLIRYCRTILLIIGLGIIAYSYHPNNFDIFGEVINDSYTKYVFAIIFSLLLLSIGSLREGLSIKPIRTYSVITAVAFISSLSLYAFNLTPKIYEIRSLVICLIAMLLGATLKLKNKDIVTICISYIIAILWIGYLQITQNIGDFVIEDLYISTAKNSFGPMIAIAGTLSILIMLSPNINKLIKIFTFSTAIISLLEITTIRARLATIIYIALLVFIVYKYLKSINTNNNSYKQLVVVAIIIGVIFLSYSTSLHEYLWDSLTQNKEDDITSGRMSAYYESIDVFTRSPFFGNLTLNEKIGWAHNYLLLKLSEYGIVFSLPLLTLFFYLVYIIITNIQRVSIFNPQFYGYIIIAISFLVSLGEPTFPYGPGTTNFLPFLLFGAALKYNYKLK